MNILSEVTQTIVGNPKSSQRAAENSLLGNVVSGLPLVGQLIGGNPPKGLAHGKESNALEKPHATVSGSTKIHGNNNVISSLLNVVPDVNINLNLLSQITELLSSSQGSQAKSFGERDGNEVCFEVPQERK